MSNEDVLVCASAPPVTFADNILANCNSCDRQIQHRPIVPDVARKLCFKCAGKELVALGLAEVRNPLRN